MSRLPRLQASGGTVHVVGRRNNREFFTTPDDFRLLLVRLGELAWTYEVTLYAYTLMANHVHPALAGPRARSHWPDRSAGSSGRPRGTGSAPTGAGGISGSAGTGPVW